jgi:predicted RNA-binding protein with PUA-like domain
MVVDGVLLKTRIYCTRWLDGDEVVKLRRLRSGEDLRAREITVMHNRLSVSPNIKYQ